MVRSSFHFVLVLAASLLASHTVRAESGVTDTELVIGTASALTGPAADLGLQLNSGAQAYITKVNAEGGVNGRKIKWLTEDDAYEPSQTSEKTKALVDRGAFTLFNYVGTPTTKAALPIIQEKDIPLVAAFTGGEVFRNPVIKNVFNVRASYWDETELMVANAVDKKGLEKIALFMQDDAYGQAGQSGVRLALEKRGLKVAAEGKFQRNTVDVDPALAEIEKAAPDAVVMVGAYKSCATFVRKARAKGMKAIFFNLSFVGTESFLREAGADADGTFITQVVPHFENSKLKVAADYLAAMTAAGRAPSYGSFEGYLNAVVLVEGLRAGGKNLTRAGFRDALEKLDKDLGGFKVAFSKTNHQASKVVFLTKAKSGKAIEVPNLD